MTTTLRSKIRAELAWTWRDHVGVAPIIDSNRLQSNQDLTDGAGDNQADVVWHLENQTLLAGQSKIFSLNMLDQSLFGDTITIRPAKVKALLIVNQNTTTSGYLLVGGAAAGEWHEPFGAFGDTVKVMPNSPLLLANARDGWDVSPGQSGLKIAAAGGSVTYDIAILGTLPVVGSSSSSSSSAI